jgi:predicted nicotinamide N-methyase
MAVSPLSLEKQNYTFGGRTVTVFLPGPAEALAQFRAVHTANPFWARVWPAALAMCRYLAANPQLVADKYVLELAGGLGLPSLYAAGLARSVVFSDLEPAAVAIVERSALSNKIDNLACRIIDLNAIPTDLHPDVVLVSDINYDPAAFDTLYEVLAQLMGSGATVLLATPQRLLAKPFIDRLLPWCEAQEEICVEQEGGTVFCSLFVLRSGK